jgi:hypothetical protein
VTHGLAKENNMITLNEHTSASYVPRTFHNAVTSDLTIAVAINYYTGGEKLTHKAAGEKFLALPFREPMIENARRLFIACRDRNVKVLNVAGNGISTYIKHGITREQVNQYIYDLLKLVVQHWPLEKVISGGQTGADIAGGIAAHKLGIDTELTFPKGFRQRDEDGIDRDHTREEILAQIEQGVALLEEKSTG